MSFRDDKTNKTLNGKYMYLAGKIQSIEKPVVAMFELDTAWDISSTTTLQNYNTFENMESSDEYKIDGISFNNDGSELYIAFASRHQDDKILKYSLSTPWDITTLSVMSSSIDIESILDPSDSSNHIDGSIRGLSLIHI